MHQEICQEPNQQQRLYHTVATGHITNRGAVRGAIREIVGELARDLVRGLTKFAYSSVRWDCPRYNFTTN